MTQTRPECTLSFFGGTSSSASGLDFLRRFLAGRGRERRGRRGEEGGKREERRGKVGSGGDFLVQAEIMKRGKIGEKSLISVLLSSSQRFFIY